MAGERMGRGTFIGMMTAPLVLPVSAFAEPIFDNIRKKKLKEWDEALSGYDSSKREEFIRAEVRELCRHIEPQNSFYLKSKEAHQQNTDYPCVDARTIFQFLVVEDGRGSRTIKITGKPRLEIYSTVFEPKLINTSLGQVILRPTLENLESKLLHEDIHPELVEKGLEVGGVYIPGTSFLPLEGEKSLYNFLGHSEIYIREVSGTRKHNGRFVNANDETYVEYVNRQFSRYHPATDYHPSYLISVIGFMQFMKAFAPDAKEVRDDGLRTAVAAQLEKIKPILKESESVLSRIMYKYPKVSK